MAFLGLLGLLLALWFVANCEREHDEWMNEGMAEYHAKMREIHGERRKGRE